MKLFNHKKIAILTLAAMTFAGCGDFLDEENRSGVSIETALADAETFDQLVANVYEVSREYTTHYTADMYYTLEDLGTDLVTRGTSVSGTDEINDYVNVNSANWVYSVYWSDQYDIVAAANVVISNASSVNGLSDSDVALRVGQAKFFRAWSYFNLVENFGGVPLVLEQVTTAQSNFTRASEQDVYAQIVSDLEDALDGVEASPADFGRVSKDAVRHLLSRVLLTRGYKSFGTSADFTKAASYAETVIVNNPLVGSFEDLVSIDNQRNSEVVFSYLFGSNSASRGWGNSRHMMYKFRYFDYPALSRGNLYQKGLGPAPTPFFYTLFSDEDERAAASFRRVIYADENSEDGSIVVGDTAIYFPKTAWPQSVIDSKPYTVINPDTYFTNNGVTVVHYPMFKKFDDPGVPFTQPDQSSQGERDMVMMRGGEAYLIAAEAYLQLNNAADAADLLTTLRSRAGIATAVSAAEVDIDFILDERARELMGEVSRWMDLKRTGKLLERTLAHNPHAALNNALAEKHYLRPIPQTEVDNSQGTIEQNAAYK
ncbi:MAG: RagB/SusD family nutrient uptake outer membrane protein [Flammeovirgaceae bacterium]|nr:RagB/SusD family nutrient uptake outer membrane protein [Flammeovirgaceae bacterium]HCX24658.1 RagB/SusD family nutrient uptake outer membrane protein [Cytophagales bacterium]